MSKTSEVLKTWEVHTYFKGISNGILNRLAIAINDRERTGTAADYHRYSNPQESPARFAQSLGLRVWNDHHALAARLDFWPDSEPKLSHLDTSKRWERPYCFNIAFGAWYLLLITAYRQWRKEDDPDGPPKWLTMVDNLNPLKAFGIGFGLLLIGAKFWVFTLSAIGTISQARLGQPSSTIAFLLFVLLAETLVLLPILIRIIIPKQSQSILEDASVCLTRHNRIIVMNVSLVFGLLFFYQGASGLLQSDVLNE